MKKQLIGIFVMLMIITGCNVDNTFVDQQENDNLLNEETNENNDTEENNEEINDNENNEVDDDSFQAEVTIVDVEDILYDQESIKLDYEPAVIEYDDKSYVHANTVLNAIDFNMTYDEAEQIFSLDEGENTFDHEPLHADDGGGIVEVSEVQLDYVDDIVKRDLFNNIDFLEYDDELFIPTNIARRMFRESFTLVEADNRLEIGLRSEPLYIDELDFAVGFGVIEGGFTRDDELTEVDGKQYEAIGYSKNTPAFELSTLSAQYAYSELKGFLYNENEFDLQFTIESTDKEDMINERVKPGDKLEFEIDVKGEKRITFFIDNEKGTIINPGADFRIYLEAY